MLHLTGTIHVEEKAWWVKVFCCMHVWAKASVPILIDSESDGYTEWICIGCGSRIKLLRNEAPSGRYYPKLYARTGDE